MKPPSNYVCAKAAIQKGCSSKKAVAQKATRRYRAQRQWRIPHAHSNTWLQSQPICQTIGTFVRPG
jgi:hypothetical protein